MKNTLIWTFIAGSGLFNLTRENSKTSLYLPLQQLEPGPQFLESMKIIYVSLSWSSGSLLLKSRQAWMLLRPHQSNLRSLWQLCNVVAVWNFQREHLWILFDNCPSWHSLWFQSRGCINKDLQCPFLSFRSSPLWKVRFFDAHRIHIGFVPTMNDAKLSGLSTLALLNYKEIKYVNIKKSIHVQDFHERLFSQSSDKKNNLTNVSHTLCWQDWVLFAALIDLFVTRQFVKHATHKTWKWVCKFVHLVIFFQFCLRARSSSSEAHALSFAQLVLKFEVAKLDKL